MKDASNGFIHSAHGAQVVLHVALEFPLGDLFFMKLARFNLGNELGIFGFIGGIPLFFLLLGHAGIFAVREIAAEVFGK